LQKVDPKGLAIETIWDAGITLYDLFFGTWEDVALDVAAMCTPVVPAGLQHFRHLKKGKKTPISRPKLDGTEKLHGDIPGYPPKKWSKPTRDELISDLETSIKKRKNEQINLGEQGPHRERIRQEERLLRQLRKK
jgi:hypothetical protein